MNLVVSELNDFNKNNISFLEKGVLTRINEIIKVYEVKFKELGFELEKNIYWILDDNSYVEIKQEYILGYCMFLEIQVMKKGKKVMIAGGETDDYCFFDDIVWIEKNKSPHKFFKKNEDYYDIYFFDNFNEIENRLNEIITYIKEFGYEYW